MCNSCKIRVERIKKDFFYSAISTLKGNVLEIGFGEGESFSHYNKETNIFALEKSENLIKESEQKLESNTDKKINFFRGKVENLPFENNFFDAVLVSFVLCSVYSVEKSLDEIHRVLKTDGKFIALEHTKSENNIIGKLQDTLEKPYAYIANGCHPNRNPRQSIILQNFKITKESYFPNLFEPCWFLQSNKN